MTQAGSIIAFVVDFRIDPVTPVGATRLLLQKSFCLTDHKFSGLYARRSNIDMGDHFIL
jgi:hypothetical protein